MLIWTLRLETEAAQRLYRRDFEHLAVLVGALDRARMFRGAPHEADPGFEQRIGAAIVTARAAGEQALRGIAAGLSRHPLTTLALLHASPLETTVGIAHPVTRAHLDMLLEADQGFAALERAWLLGLVDTRDRRNREDALRQAVRSVGAAIRSAYSDRARQLRSRATPTAADHGSGMPSSATA